MIEIGQLLPNVTLFIEEASQAKAISTRAFFVGRRVALFAVPGAFTPTCSSAHVPRFNALARDFRRAGIDAVVCLAVNDLFVLGAWQQKLGAESLQFLADPKGDFARAVGLLKDLGPLGLRSRRYALIARDGVVEHCFVEADHDGDPFEVSDADSLLSAHTGVLPPPAVLLFALEGCPRCAKTKELLDQRGLDYEVLHIGEQLSMQAVRAATGRHQVPQVFIDGECIGGYEDLQRAFGANPG